MLGNLVLWRGNIVFISVGLRIVLLGDVYSFATTWAELNFQKIDFVKYRNELFG